MALNQTLTLVVNASVSAASGNVTNTAVASSGTPDPVAANNSAPVVTLVGSSADLSVSKVISGAAVQGSTVSYTVSRNSGCPPHSRRR